MFTNRQLGLDACIKQLAKQLVGLVKEVQRKDAQITKLTQELTDVRGNEAGDAGASSAAGLAPEATCTSASSAAEPTGGQGRQARSAKPRGLRPSLAGVEKIAMKLLFEQDISDCLGMVKIDDFLKSLGLGDKDRNRIALPLESVQHLMEASDWELLY